MLHALCVQQQIASQLLQRTPKSGMMLTAARCLLPMKEFLSRTLQSPYYTMASDHMPHNSHAMLVDTLNAGLMQLQMQQVKMPDIASAEKLLGFG